jgi:PKD repeat protein
MRRTLRGFALFATIIVVAVSFHPALDPFWDIIFTEDDEYLLSLFDTAKASEPIYAEYPTFNQTHLAEHVQTLIDETPSDQRMDTDGDGAYDVVERVIGTDYNNSDTDFDGLNDYFEIFNSLDPLQPDSNYDGLADYFEITNVSIDCDNDSILNQWDWDNDGDGVIDSLDISPFSVSAINDRFNFTCNTNGKPTYINYQIQPKELNHLRLPVQSWDWPDDQQGLMKDLNGSDDDVFITPFLEMTIETDFIMRFVHSDKCLEVSNKTSPLNATVWQNTYNEDPSQHWMIEEVSAGYYVILSSANGLCLEAYNGSTNTFSPIILGVYEGYDHQQWKLEIVDDTCYTLVAKHSEKCIEVENASINDTASIWQNVYTGGSNQKLYLEPVGDVLPDSTTLLEYGISLNLNKMNIPLSPVQDLGAPVAFQGKFFYNISTPVQLVHDAKLLWMVTGKSDKTMRGFQVHSGQYVNLGEENLSMVYANASSITNLSVFECVDLGKMKYALKASNGCYLTVCNDVNNTLYATSTEINDDEIFEMILVDTKICLKASNGKYVSAVNGGGSQLTANKNIISDWEKFSCIPLEYESEVVTLVKYYEDFRITGINIQENHGSSLQLFYDADVNHSLKAGIALSYEFLRSQQPLSDMSIILGSRNVTVNATDCLSYDHQDKGLVALISYLIPTVVSELHNMTNDTTLPFLTCIEDHVATVTINELDVSPSNLIEIDLSGTKVTTIKSMKISWYNTTSSTPLDIENIFDEMNLWGASLGFNQTDDAVLTMIGLVLTWNVGESMITQIGGIPIEFSLPETSEVMSILSDYVWTSLTALVDLTLAIKKGADRGYSFLKYTINILQSITKSLKIQSGISKLLKGIRAVQQVLNGAKATKFFSVLDRLGPWFLVIDLVITAGIAWYLWFSIAIDQGWSDFGVFLAFVVYYSYVIYSLVIIGIGLIFPLLALIFVILDLIFDIFGKFLEWILSIFTKTTPLSNVDLVFKGSPSLDTYDYDDNGLDEGDRIAFQTQVISIVDQAHSLSDLQQSYMVPLLTLSVPPGVPWNKTSTVLDVETDGLTYRNTTYELGVWAEPPQMVNFPMNIQLQYSYQIYYEECVWFFGWWCDRESKSETKTTDITTLYFDILPNDIDSFLDWKEIRSIDVDGDGIRNDEEFEHMANPWQYDSDGDGLWDGYEVEQGILPHIADTDGDGLNDGLEAYIKTDPNKMDTDGDGLSDYEEYRGWEITFSYFEYAIYRLVKSDPLKYDSDADGLDDLQEYIRCLNPLSNDTDGDTIIDKDEGVVPYRGFITSVDFNKKGNSVRVLPNETINVTCEIRFRGINCTSGGLANLNITAILRWSNDSVNITQYYPLYNDTPSDENLSTNTTSFVFNASAFEGLFLLYYVIDWSCYGPMPPLLESEIIGIVEVNNSLDGTNIWECNAEGTDNDRDGILNIHESLGWQVTFTNSSGTHTIHVTSDPNMVDTDSDGIPDYYEHDCFINSTNPRNPDTDGDGLADNLESLYKTNPLHNDTDGDGLDDHTELIFRSSPLQVDSDEDGLDDHQEFIIGSNPKHPDTDHDGLDDFTERSFNSSLFLPDSDGDTLFDADEYKLGTDPQNKDTDGDGLIDGYEALVGTNATKNDTDDDGLFDFDEIYWQTNPLSQDSDDDGYLDGDEVFYGTHPLVSDSDFDGMNDSEDLDSYASHVPQVVVAYDLTEKAIEFAGHLSEYTNVTKVNAQTFLSDPIYRNASYIVLIGRPDAGNGTVGNISKGILESSKENISLICSSDDYRFSLKYGIWNASQTVIILTAPYRSDHWIVLNLLKNMRKTILSDSSVLIEFPTPRTLFDVDTIDELGCYLRVSLNENVIPTVHNTRYNNSNIPYQLNWTSGLASGHQPVGFFIDINVSEVIQNETFDRINETWILCYYTAQDLDRTDDGDCIDAGDIREDTLAFYFLNETLGKWVQLSDTMEWVIGTGLETTNTKMYGVEYEGYIWAHVTHLSLYGLAGTPRTSSTFGKTVFPPTAHIEVSDTIGYVNTMFVFNGSQSTDDGNITSYHWDFGDGSNGTGETVIHKFYAPGAYTVTLTVTDDGGLKDSETVNLSVYLPNIPPFAPSIFGLHYGTVNTSFNFEIVSIDPDGESLRYHIDWGDGIEYISSFAENNTKVPISHIWNETGYYVLKAYAEDTSNVSSSTTTFLVFIDVMIRWIDGSLSGCFIDIDSDGSYDVFYDNKTVSETPVHLISEGTYGIDIDKDGIYEYQFDSITGKLDVYDPNEPRWDLFLISFCSLVVVLVCGVFLWYWNVSKERKKKELMKKEQEMKRTSQNMKQSSKTNTVKTTKGSTKKKK